MKQKIPIIIAIILLFQSAGYFLLFEIKQMIIREEIKESIERGVPDNQLILFKVPLNTGNRINPDLKRVNKSEFRYRGEMYDVVKQYTRGDSIWYYCINDEKETALFSKLDQVVKAQQENDPDYKNFMQQQQKILSLLYDLPAFSFNIFITNILNKWYTMDMHYLSTILAPLKPPPEFSFFI